MIQKIKIKDIQNKTLLRFTRIVREEEIEYIKSIDIKNKEHVLYKVGKILVITADDYLITEWDEEFEYLWNNYFNIQNNQK